MSTKNIFTAANIKRQAKNLIFAAVIAFVGTVIASLANNEIDKPVLFVYLLPPFYFLFTFGEKAENVLPGIYLVGFGSLLIYSELQNYIAALKISFGSYLAICGFTIVAKALGLDLASFKNTYASIKRHFQ